MSDTVRRVRELSAALRNFVRLVAREDVERLEAEVSAVRQRVAELEARAERLERGEREATSRRAWRGPGTP